MGQLAARAALLLGAGQVIVIDRLPERLEQVRTVIGADTLDYTSDSIAPELMERTGGRGPDICIEAVGMEAHSNGPQFLYDQVKQQLRLQTDRPTALRQAVYSCRKGGSLFVLGVYALMVDKFPLGAAMNKGLTLRGAQQHGHRYIPAILDRMAKGEITAEHLATHIMPLSDGPRGYSMFKDKTDGCDAGGVPAGRLTKRPGPRTCGPVPRRVSRCCRPAVGLLPADVPGCVALRAADVDDLRLRSRLPAALCHLDPTGLRALLDRGSSGAARRCCSWPAPGRRRRPRRARAAV